MPLSAEKIDAIRNGTDIVQVVGRSVSLKQKGKRWWGLCPFHNEKTPSFSVVSETGFFYCFGCHAGGDVFSFVMMHRGLRFGEAARELAQLAGVEIEPESPEVAQRRKERARLVQANNYAQAFFEHALWSDEGKPARAYLVKRGVSEKQARFWRLGFGGTRGALLRYLEAKKVPAALGGRAGFLNDDNTLGLMDGRLVFPIIDEQGHVAGFGGRRLGEGDGPKYINSRDGELFAKRRLLYGFHQASEMIRKSQRVVLVEGYMDVIACHAAGVDQAVAALGTSFTDDHARGCARLAKEVVMLFDADQAGQRAAREATGRAVAAKLKVLFAPLPKGDDPDSLVRRTGKGALQDLLREAVPAVEHFVDQAFDGDLSIQDKVAAARELAPLLEALPSGLERDLYVSRLAERLGASVEQVRQHLRDAQEQRPKPKREESAAPRVAAAPSQPEPPTRSSPTRFELDALAELLLYPELRPQLVELSDYTSDAMRALLDDLSAEGDPLAELLARHIPDSAQVKRLCAIVPRGADGVQEAMEEENGAERTFEDVLARFKERRLGEVIEALRQELAEQPNSGEETRELIQRIQDLTRRKRSLRGSRIPARQPEE